MALRMASRVAGALARCARTVPLVPSASVARPACNVRTGLAAPVMARSFLPASVRNFSSSAASWNTGAAASKPQQSKGVPFLMPATIGVAVITSGLSVVFFGGPFSEEEKKVPHVREVSDAADKENIVLAYLTRAKTRMLHLIDEQINGTQELLLPPLLPAQYRLTDYTLVLDLEDTLIHNEWSPDYGWRTRKRPGVDEFLHHVAMTLGFEIVIYSDKNAMDGATQIIDRLDPNQYVLYKLYRGHQSSVNGEPVKDLSKLNRDLKKVIIIDDKPENFRLHPYNGIKIKKYTGDPEDRALLELIPFLQAIIEANVDDVRVVLERYKGIDDIPKAFNEAKGRVIAERRAQLEAQQAAQAKAQKETAQAAKPKQSWSSWLGF